MPLSECDDAVNGEVLHRNHFLLNGIPSDEKEAVETHSGYCNAASSSDLSDFEDSLDCVTVDSSEILSVPASGLWFHGRNHRSYEDPSAFINTLTKCPEFVEVQMEADSRLINENDIENIDLENVDIENICILPGEFCINLAIPREKIVS